MTPEIVNNISERYIELFEKVTGENFKKPSSNEDIQDRIKKNILNAINANN